MDKIIARLKQQAEENPVVVIGVGAALLQGISKLMNANSARKNSKTYKREIARRERIHRGPRYR